MKKSSALNLHWGRSLTEADEPESARILAAGISPAVAEQQLEFARWQEDLLERRSSQYDTGIGSVLVVAGLIATASAAALAFDSLGKLPAWPLIISTIAAILGSFVLMAASLVRTSADEKRQAWQDSTAVTSGEQLILAMDKRSKALRDHLAYRRALVYIGYGFTLLAGGFVVIYMFAAGAAK